MSDPGGRQGKGLDSRVPGALQSHFLRRPPPPSASPARGCLSLCVGDLQGRSRPTPTLHPLWSGSSRIRAKTLTGQPVFTSSGRRLPRGTPACCSGCKTNVCWAVGEGQWGRDSVLRPPRCRPGLQANMGGAGAGAPGGDMSRSSCSLSPTCGNPDLEEVSPTSGTQGRPGHSEDPGLLQPQVTDFAGQ